MESLLVDPQMMSYEQQQLVVKSHLLRRRRSSGATSSESCSSSSHINGEDDDDDDDDATPTSSPLQDMTPLLLQLPLKRGLSKHYNGKSQSFTSLSNVKSLEDLAKQEKYPFKKKLKLCNSTRKERAIN